MVEHRYRTPLHTPGSRGAEAGNRRLSEKGAMSQIQSENIETPRQFEGTATLTELNGHPVAVGSSETKPLPPLSDKPDLSRSDSEQARLSQPTPDDSGSCMIPFVDRKEAV